MPDDKRILSGADDSTVRVWLLDGTLKDTFELHTGMVLAVALPDNQHALSGSGDHTVKLFNVSDGAACAASSRTRGDGPGAARRPRFASCAGDQTACVAYHGLAPRPQ